MKKKIANANFGEVFDDIDDSGGEDRGIDRSKLGKQNKRKGARYQTASAQFWSKILNTKMKSTPRSGAFWDWPADIFDMGNSILKDFIIECKFGKTAVPKKIETKMDELQNDEETFNKMPAPKKIINWMSKLKDESQHKPHFLEMSLPYKEPLIVIRMPHFSNLVSEWENFKKVKGKLPYRYLKLGIDLEPCLVVIRRKDFAIILKDLNNFRKTI